MFKLLDIDNGGLVDIRDFSCLISIIKSGSIEDKLRLAFKAYDINGDGFLDKVSHFIIKRLKKKIF